MTKITVLKNDEVLVSLNSEKEIAQFLAEQGVKGSLKTVEKNVKRSLKSDGKFEEFTLKIEEEKEMTQETVKEINEMVEEKLKEGITVTNLTDDETFGPQGEPQIFKTENEEITYDSPEEMNGAPSAESLKPENEVENEVKDESVPEVTDETPETTVPEIENEQKSEDPKPAETPKEEKENKKRVGKTLIAYKNDKEYMQFPSIKAAATHFKEVMNLGHMPFTPIMKSARQNVDWNEYSFKFENEKDLHIPESLKKKLSKEAEEKATQSAKQSETPTETPVSDTTESPVSEVIEEIIEEIAEEITEETPTVESK